MPDNPNDVVRHVILRILVDQAGLSEEMAAARAKLKALKDAEKPINEDRAKSASKVTDALTAQNAVLEQNRQAHEASKRAAAGQSTSAVEGLKAQSKQIAANTEAVKGQIKEEAQAEAIRTAARQKELDAQRARSAAKKKDTDDETKRAQELQQLEEKGRQDRLRSETQRTAARNKSNESVAGQVIKNQALERNELLKTDALKENLSNREKQRLISEKAARANAAQLTGAQVDKIQAQTGTEQARTETEQARTAKTSAQTQAVRSNAQNQRAIERNKADADIARRDENAAATRQRAEDLATSNVERRRLESETRIAKAQEVHEEKVTTLRQSNQQKLANQALTDVEKLAAARARTADVEMRASQAQEARQERLDNQRRTNQSKLGTQALKDIEAIAQAQDRTSDLRSKASDAAERRDATRPSFIESTVAKNVSGIEIAGAKVDVAQSQAQVAAARALNEEDRTNVEIGTRRERTEIAIARAKADVQKVAAQALLTEQRTADLAERRARVSRRQNTTVIGSAEALVGNATTGIGTLLFKGPDNTRFDNGLKAMRDVQAEGGKAKAAISAFFGAFKNGDREASSVLEHITARVRNFVKELKPSASGGGNLFNNIISNVGDLASAFERGFSKMGGHLVSFQSLVIVVIAALGPLVAILGAVGAAALGLASNIGALVGVFAALPGIVGAAVAGFGALALVMKPISNVFSAYSAAQKEATKSTTAATKATNDLNEARTAAKRKLEDYALALKGIQTSETGASLNVEAAELAYRKALADPTATDLDRRQALNAVQQAKLDQAANTVANKRTVEDAATAQKKGIEGSDEVTSVTSSTQAAQDAYQAALDKLPAKTRKVVEAIFALQKQYDKLRDTFSDNIFGPLSSETGKFKDVLKILSDFMTPATKAIGDFAKSALDLLTSPDWKKFFSDQGVESGKIIAGLGSALLYAADGFRAIVEQARPFTTFVVDGIKGVAKSFDSWASGDKGRKSITDFLELTKQRVQEIWPILKNFAAGFAGFFSALNAKGTMDDGTDFTTSFNKGLLSISESFRKLGEQAADPKSGFRQWLHDVMPLLKDVGHFLSEAGKFFGNLFSDPDNLKEGEGLLRAIADKWLPKLANIFDKLSQSGLISKLANAIGSIFSGIETFLDHGGMTAIKGFATVIKDIAAVLDWMVQHVPGLAAILGGLAIAFSAALGAGLLLNIGKLIGKFTGLSAVIKGIRDLFTGEFKNNLKDALTGSAAGSTSAAKNAGGGAANASTGGVLPTLYRMESTLLQIAAYTRQTAINTGGIGSAGLDADGDSSKSKEKKAANALEDDVESATKGTKSKGIRSFLKGLLGFGAEEVATTAATTAVAGTAAAKSGGFFSGIKKFFGGGSNTASEASTAGNLVEDAASTASKGGKLLKFAKGGPAAIAASILATVAGDTAINHFVKNDADKGSLTRGLGAVATGAGIGATIGSIVPGVGTAIGGAVGGLAGGAYSLVKDKNLRSFVGDKLDSAGKALSGGGIGGAALGMLAGGPLGALLGGSDIGKSILDSLKKAAGGVSDFFTKTIPAAFTKGVAGIKTFFTKTLPNLAGDAFDRFFIGIGRIAAFFVKDLPRYVAQGAKAIWNGLVALTTFFTVTLPKAVWDFFTVKLPAFAVEGWNWVNQNLFTPIKTFITKDIPKFFTDTIPKWFAAAPTWFKDHVVDPITDFFTVKIPAFFTTTLPNAIASLPSVVYNNLIQPVLDFFKGLKDHVGDFIKGGWDWAKSLFSRAGGDLAKGYSGKMSGGLIEGVYQGIQDTAHIMATPGEFMVRKSKVDEPGAKAFLGDFNEGRVTMADLYNGLSAATRPQVMSMVPPGAQSMTGAVPTVVNNTVNHAPLMGDVTIHNPVREKSEYSLRRRVQLAANRHRR